MTLPNDIKLIELDPGIRQLVININRIPGVYTQTNCEGHVYRDCPAMPTKDGWIYFNKLVGQHDTLTKTIYELCNDNKIFTLEDYSLPNAIENRYAISGLFEPYQGENGLKAFNEMNLKEQQRYWYRADLRKIELLKGWNNINHIVVEYIMQNISQDIFKLPYRDPNNRTQFGSSHHF